MKKILSLALSLVMLFTGVCVTGVSAENEVTDTLAKLPSGSLSNLQSYEDYMAAAGDFSAANGEIVIDAVNFAASVGAEVEKVATFKPENGKEASTVIKWTNEDGAVTYNVTVPADGLYTVKFNYYAMPSRKNPVAIGLKVDGKVLFDGMQEFELPRLFTDNADPVLDEQGNPVLDENGNPKTTTVRTDGIGNEFAAEQVEVFHRPHRLRVIPLCITAHRRRTHPDR